MARRAKNKKPSATAGKRSGSSPDSLGNKGGLRVSIERTGGFTGIRLSTILDAETLPPHETEQLCQLIEAADFFNLPPQIVSPAPQPDRFQYKLGVNHDGRKHSVRVAEEEVPASLRPLIEILISAAREKG